MDPNTVPSWRETLARAADEPRRMLPPVAGVVLVVLSVLLVAWLLAVVGGVL